jgi:hypothetical protein
LGIHGHRTSAGNSGETFGPREFAVAHSDVLAGDEFRSKRTSQVAGMKAANVAATDESDDWMRQWTLAIRWNLPAFYCALARRWRSGGLALPYSETRPPAEEITWGRK